MGKLRKRLTLEKYAVKYKTLREKYGPLIAPSATKQTEPQPTILEEPIQQTNEVVEEAIEPVATITLEERTDIEETVQEPKQEKKPWRGKKFREQSQ